MCKLFIWKGKKYMVAYIPYPPLTFCTCVHWNGGLG